MRNAVKTVPLRKGLLMSRVLLFATIALVLVGCETPTTQRYAISPDNNQAIRALNTTGIGVGAFTSAASFDASCRAFGPIQVADGLTHVEYIRRAFEDELKVAGAFAPSSPRITLSGTVSRLEFSECSAALQRRLYVGREGTGGALEALRTFLRRGTWHGAWAAVRGQDLRRPR